MPGKRTRTNRTPSSASRTSATPARSRGTKASILYGETGDRLLKGFEYTARYNLGADVAVRRDHRSQRQVHPLAISTEGRGRLRPVYEQIYNHYVNRAGLAAPWTQRAAEKLRPEGEGRPGADHTGFGTLLYSRSRSDVEPTASLQPPAGLIATGSDQEVRLTWIPVRGATAYTVSAPS